MKKILVAISLVFIAGNTYAEYYVGGSLDYLFGQRWTNMTNIENLNYPEPSSPSNPAIGGGNVTPTTLNNTLGASLKVGKYFDDYPSLGFEVAFNYNKVKMGNQWVSVSNPAYNTYPGWNQGTTLTEYQQTINGNLFQFAFNGLYRYKDPDSKFIPYIGGGPTLNYLRLYGTGLTAITNTDPNGVNGPAINTVSNTVGANILAGLMYDIGDSYKIGLEYRWNWVPFTVQNVRSSNRLTGDYYTNTLGIQLTKSFN
jgi:opacity protein-like surface antigen